VNNYIIVKTLCNKEEVAKRIINSLLEKNLVSGVQVSEVYSKYWWKNAIEEQKEYKLEFYTKEDNYHEIEYEIKKNHDYYVCEISAIELKYGSKEFLDWIDEIVK
jgi:periplasmic divalent cation tolerance protein